MHAHPLIASYTFITNHSCLSRNKNWLMVQIINTKDRIKRRFQILINQQRHTKEEVKSQERNHRYKCHLTNPNFSLHIHKPIYICSGRKSSSNKSCHWRRGRGEGKLCPGIWRLIRIRYFKLMKLKVDCRSSRCWWTKLNESLRCSSTLLQL